MGPLQLGVCLILVSVDLSLNLFGWILADLYALAALGRLHWLTNYLRWHSIGLDTCLAIQQTLYEGTSDSKYRPSVLLERMVDAQWYGKKNGKGFYEYEN